MPVTISSVKVKRGILANIPVLLDGEPAFTTDTFDLYVGWSGTNHKIGGSGTVTHATSALTAHAVIVGNGGADEKPLASLGTTTTVLHGNAAGDPSFGAVVEADQSLSDVTTLNVSIARHGYVPKAPNDTGQYLCGDGTWRTPPNGGIFFFLAKGGIIISGTCETPYAGETSFTGAGGVVMGGSAETPYAGETTVTGSGGFVITE